jgi:hypothetical protein
LRNLERGLTSVTTLISYNGDQKEILAQEISLINEALHMQRSSLMSIHEKISGFMGESNDKERSELYAKNFGKCLNLGVNSNCSEILFKMRTLFMSEFRFRCSAPQDPDSSQNSGITIPSDFFDCISNPLFSNSPGVTRELCNLSKTISQLNHTFPDIQGAIYLSARKSMIVHCTSSLYKDLAEVLSIMSSNIKFKSNLLPAKNSFYEMRFLLSCVIDSGEAGFKENNFSTLQVPIAGSEDLFLSFASSEFGGFGGLCVSILNSKYGEQKSEVSSLANVTLSFPSMSDAVMRIENIQGLGKSRIIKNLRNFNGRLNLILNDSSISRNDQKLLSIVPDTPFEAAVIKHRLEKGDFYEVLKEELKSYSQTLKNDFGGLLLYKALIVGLVYFAERQGFTHIEGVPRQLTWSSLRLMV